MLALLGIIIVGLINVCYFIAAGYLSFVWADGDNNRLRKYHNRFSIVWLATAFALFVYYRDF